jgi:CHASE3 domain sensor protein
LAAVLKTETAGWGYIISGNRKFLEILRESAEKTGTLLGRLRMLLRHLPAQRDRLQTLEGSINSKFEMTRTAIALRDSAVSEAGSRLFESHMGELKAIRAQIAGLANDETLAYQDRADDFVADFTVVYSALLLVFLINNLLILLAVRLTWREAHRIRKREVELLDQKQKQKQKQGDAVNLRTAELNELSNLPAPGTGRGEGLSCTRDALGVSSSLAAVKIDISHVRDKLPPWQHDGDPAVFHGGSETG